MASVSRAACGVQMPCLNGREAPAGRRSVAAPRARNAKRGVIRAASASASGSGSVSGSGRGQHCAPANAVADAAPITATKVTAQLLQLDSLDADCRERLVWQEVASRQYCSRSGDCSVRGSFNLVSCEHTSSG